VASTLIKSRVWSIVSFLAGLRTYQHQNKRLLWTQVLIWTTLVATDMYAVFPILGTQLFEKIQRFRFLCMHSICQEQCVSNYSIRILLSEGGQYLFSPLSSALQLLAAISENRIPSDKEKSFSMKKKGKYIPLVIKVVWNSIPSHRVKLLFLSDKTPVTFSKE